MNPTLVKVLYAVAWTATWWALILSATGDCLPWMLAGAYGLLLAHLIVARAQWRDWLPSVIGACLAAILIDGVLATLGILSFAHHELPAPVPPLWILCLWLWFALAFHNCLNWLHGRIVIAILFGTISAVAGYYGGMHFGVVTTSIAPAAALGLIAAGFALVTPLFAQIAPAESNTGEQLNVA